jgi:nitrite reductase (NO-forming)
MSLIDPIHSVAVEDNLSGDRFRHSAITEYIIMKNLTKTARRHGGVAVATMLLGLTVGYSSAAENEIRVLSNALKGIDPEVTGLETAVLAQAPNVPPPITRKHATKVVVNLEAREVVKQLADGVEYVFWTFGGSVPGNFIRVREGDEIEFHLNNHQNNKMPHSIDLHAVSGPGGGAASSFTAPGHSSQFSFKALHSGLFVYHCATAPVGMHIGNGMYGLILVEPKEGLPPVDHEYYVMQGEFYTTGKYGDQGLQGFDMDKAIEEQPPYVVFNGAVDSLVGDRALTAKVGETTRLFFGNGGPNLTSSFHIIGGQFDALYEDGTITNVLHSVQTTAVPPGSAVIVDFKAHAPGTYVLVDHAIFRAFNKGALGMLKVDGPQNLLVYSGKEVDATYIGKAAEAGSEAEKKVAALQAQMAEEIKSNPKIAGLTKDIQVQKGKAVFMQTCFVCHQPEGQGVAGQIPPLAKSDFLATLSKEDYIRGVLMGRTGQIVVNGKTYNGTMVPLNYLSDEQIANVLTYVRNSWGNSGEAVTPREVSRIRQSAAPPPTKSEFE